MIELPERPGPAVGCPVAAWAAPVVIPTYLTPPADRNPMFLEKRVYQGSSGRVYPNPVVDSVSDERIDKAWAAVHLENEYVRLMVLPELGGRIHVEAGAEGRGQGAPAIVHRNSAPRSDIDPVELALLPENSLRRVDVHHRQAAAKSLSHSSRA